MTVPIPEDDVVEDPVSDALLKFTGCIGEALEAICSYGLTMGDSYVPFDPDEDDDACDDVEDGTMCSQAWVRVMSIGPAPSAAQTWEGDTCEIPLAIALEVGVLRCVEVPEKGEAPTESQVLAASLQALDDMRAILCAALKCEVWDAINVGIWSPFGPMGGQYGGTWTFTVEIV